SNHPGRSRTLGDRHGTGSRGDRQMARTRTRWAWHTPPGPEKAPVSQTSETPMAAPAASAHAATIAIVLVLLVGAAFAPCLRNDFAWDDVENFVENPFYRGLGWDQLRWAWTSFRLGVYQPLAWMILETEYVFSGLRPWGYHFASLVLYAANTVVL